MPLEIDRSRSEHVKIRFILDTTHPQGPVSVVGSFNNWTPGLDELADDGDGRRGVTVAMPYGREVMFRYLGPGDRWFNEPDADEITPRGSVIHAIDPPHGTTS